jgi:hypothetical protein
MELRTLDEVPQQGIDIGYIVTLDNLTQLW